MVYICNVSKILSFTTGYNMGGTIDKVISICSYCDLRVHSQIIVWLNVMATYVKYVIYIKINTN